MLIIIMATLLSMLQYDANVTGTLCKYNKKHNSKSKLVTQKENPLSNYRIIIKER